MRHFNDIVQIVCDDLKLTREEVYATPGTRTQNAQVHMARTAIVIAAHSNIENCSYPTIAAELGFKSHGSLRNWQSQRKQFDGMYPGGFGAVRYAAEVWARVMLAVGGAA
jgi:uncharacterized protein (DUF1697 family)